MFIFFVLKIIFLHRKFFQIAGLETNVRFLVDLTKNEEFLRGNVHTNFIKENFESLFQEQTPSDNELIQAALATVLTEELDVVKDAIRNSDQFNPFIAEAGFRVNYKYCRDLEFRYGERS